MKSDIVLTKIDPTVPYRTRVYRRSLPDGPVESTFWGEFVTSEGITDEKLAALQLRGRSRPVWIDREFGNRSFKPGLFAALALSSILLFVGILLSEAFGLRLIPAFAGIGIALSLGLGVWALRNVRVRYDLFEAGSGTSQAQHAYFITETVSGLHRLMTALSNHQSALKTRNRIRDMASQATHADTTWWGFGSARVKAESVQTVDVRKLPTWWIMPALFTAPLAVVGLEAVLLRAATMPGTYGSFWGGMLIGAAILLAIPAALWLFVMVALVFKGLVTNDWSLEPKWELRATMAGSRQPVVLGTWNDRTSAELMRDHLADRRKAARTQPGETS